MSKISEFNTCFSGIQLENIYCQKIRINSEMKLKQKKIYNFLLYTKVYE
jgi:hypothetical protein